jgi:hypothetical protein
MTAHGWRKRQIMQWIPSEQKQEPLTDWQKDWFYSLILAMQAKRDERAEQLKREQRKRKWVGLSDEEKEKFVVNYYSSKWDRKTAVVLMNDYEAKLREKNT